MSVNSKPHYRRILLKLSGEALMGAEGFGIDPKILDRMAQEIKELIEMGIQVGLLLVVVTYLEVRDLPKRA